MPVDDAAPTPDPIDVELAHIDARDPGVAEEIEEVEEDAERLGRDVEQQVTPSDEPNREY